MTEPTLLTAAEAAGTLRVSRSTFDRLIKDGSLPVLRQGRRVFVRPTVLRMYLERIEQTTAEHAARVGQ